MHPYISQQLAAERARDMRSHAKAAEQARLVRRGRHAGSARAAVIRSGHRLVHRAA
jgi:hypothetical protein